MRDLYKSDDDKDRIGHELDPHIVFLALGPEGKSFCRGLIRDLRAQGIRAWLDGVRSPSLTAAFDKWIDGESLIFSALVGPREARDGEIAVRHAKTAAKECLPRQELIDRLMEEINQGESQ